LYCTPTCSGVAKYPTQPRQSTVIVLRSSVLPLGVFASAVSAQYQRKSPFSNVRRTECLLPSIHSKGSSRHSMLIPKALVDAKRSLTPCTTPRCRYFTGARPSARLIFSVFETYGQSCSALASSSHSNTNVRVKRPRSGSDGCASITAGFP
jgi:hypothetical protein